MSSEGGIGEFSNEVGVMQLSPALGKVSSGLSAPLLFTLLDFYVLLIYHITCLYLDYFGKRLHKSLFHILLRLDCEIKKGVLECEKGEMQLLLGLEKGRNAIIGEFYNYMEEAYV